MTRNIQSVLDYVEGRISITEFQKILFSDKKLQKILDSYAHSIHNCIFKTELVQYISHLHDRYADIASLQEVLEGFLRRNNIDFLPYLKYREDYRFLLQIQPSWLDIINDQGIFEKIIEEIPQELSKTKQIAWGKARIKELFRYEKTYPRWVQGAEWPIVDGKPLVFSHQSKEKKEDERVYYYFYNPDTEEQIIIEQMY